MFTIYSKRIAFYMYLGFIVSVLFTGCSKDNNPLNTKESDHDHAEAAGFVVMTGDELGVKYEEGVVIGSFALLVNQTSSVFKIQFIAEDGDLFTPEGDAYDFTWEIGNTNIAGIIYNQVDGKWQFKLQGKSAGVTTIIFKINHNDHADFVGLPVTITVSNPIGNSI